MVQTAIGPVGIAANTRGLVALVLPRADADATERDLVDVVQRQRQRAAASGRSSRARARRAKADPVALLDALAARVTTHFDGEAPDGFADVPVDMSWCSDFSAKVYRALRRVGPGATTNYGALATAAGSPGGARAVGSAMATNPVPLVVPCHRVLRSSDLGAFSSPGGAATKLELLELEGASCAELRDIATRHLRRDPRLRPLIARAGACGLGEGRAPDALTALARSIVHQQVSVAAGRTIFGRLLDACGARGQRDDRRLDARRVLDADDATLRAAGLSARKASYVRAIAARAAAGEIDDAVLSRRPNEAVIATLSAIRGVGRWTAEMYLMFQLGRLDVLPVGDLGVQRGIQRVFELDEQPSAERMTELAAAWAPFRSVAAWYLWRGLDCGGLPS